MSDGKTRPRRTGADSPIATARRTAGMTQGQLAEAIGMSQNQISNWECGMQKAKLDTLTRIADALGCQVTELTEHLAQERKTGPLPQHNGSPIAAARIAAGMTQAQLAAAIGVHPASISNWEGGRNRPYRKKARRIAETLGCRVEDLVGEDKPRVKSREDTPPPGIEQACDEWARAARHLRAAREAKGITQHDLAQLIDHTHRHVLKLENGEKNMADLSKKTLRKLCDVLDITPESLIGECKKTVRHKEKYEGKEEDVSAERLRIAKEKEIMQREFGAPKGCSFVIQSPTGETFYTNKILEFTKNHKEIFPNTVSAACSMHRMIRESRRGNPPPRGYFGWKAYAAETYVYPIHHIRKIYDYTIERDNGMLMQSVDLRQLIEAMPEEFPDADEAERELLRIRKQVGKNGRSIEKYRRWRMVEPDSTENGVPMLLVKTYEYTFRSQHGMAAWVDTLSDLIRMMPNEFTGLKGAQSGLSLGFMAGNWKVVDEAEACTILIRMPIKKARVKFERKPDTPLRIALRLRGMTGSELGGQIGKSSGFISCRVTGKIKIKAMEAREMAGVLDISAEYLMGNGALLAVHDSISSETAECPILCEKAIDGYGTLYTVEYPQYKPMAVILAGDFQYTPKNRDDVPSSPEDIARFEWMDQNGNQAEMRDGLPWTKQTGKEPETNR